MPSIIFIHPDGKSERVEANDGQSAMQAATMHGLDGILAECGGNAMCATCHVYVDETWADRVPDVSEDEDALLEGIATERLPTSRLSCQIHVTAALDGIVLRLPERQI